MCAAPEGRPERDGNSVKRGPNLLPLAVEQRTLKARRRRRIPFVRTRVLALLLKPHRQGTHLDRAWLHFIQHRPLAL